MQISNLIHEPIVTEKALFKAAKGIYTFKVNKLATKGAIENELKELYGIKVKAVRTRVMPGKQKRVISKRPYYSRTSSWKKAEIELHEGQKLDIYPESREGEATND